MARDITAENQIKEEITIAWNGVQIEGTTKMWNNDAKASALETELKKADNTAEAKLNSNRIKVKYKGYETTIDVNNGSMTALAKIGEDDGNPFAEIMRTAQKHPNQHNSDDIGIDAYGKIINLDNWIYMESANGYILEDPDGSQVEVCYLPLKYQWEQNSLYTPYADKHYVVCPQYIKKSGENSYKEVIRLNDLCFDNCSELKKIILPSTIKEIGRKSFESCINMKGTIELPPSVTKIEEGSFDMAGAKKLKISSNINYEEGAFSNSKFTSIIFGEGCSSVQSGGLEGCNQLYRVYFDSASLVSQLYNSSFTFGYNCPVDTILIKQELYDSSKNSLTVGLNNSNTRTFNFKGIYNKANNNGTELDSILGSGSDSLDGYAVYMSGNTTSYNSNDDEEYNTPYDVDNDTIFYPQFDSNLEPEQGSEDGSEDGSEEG